MLSNGARVCLVVLSGIPACGKTSVASELCASLKDRGTATLLVEYDKILVDVGDGTIFGATAADESVVASSSWRRARREISGCVRELVKDLLESDGRLGDGASHHAKQETASAIQRRFWYSVLDHLPDSYERLAIVLDDNMYYRSMRYEYYVIARSYGTGFAEVHIDVPLSVAMARNAKRKESVPEDVIVNMASRIERPDAKRNWEWNACILSNDGSRSLQDITSAACHAIDYGFSNPVTIKSTTEVEFVTQSADESAVHQVDIFLRKLVSDHVAATKRSGVRSEDVRQAAKCANDVRHHLLQCLKEGSLYLPDCGSTSAAAEAPCTLAAVAQAPLPTPDSYLNRSWQHVISSVFENLVTLGT